MTTIRSEIRTTLTKDGKLLAGDVHEKVKHQL